MADLDRRSFVQLALGIPSRIGHGYVVVSATGTTFEMEFVCIPRPLERAPGNDGGPLVYRVRHRAKLWRSTPA
jgi:hypothetical protein